MKMMNMMKIIIKMNLKNEYKCGKLQRHDESVEQDNHDETYEHEHTKIMINDEK